VRLADAALYRAKAIGRGGVAVFDPAAENDAVGRAAPEDAACRAVAESKIGVVFQPIVALATGRIGGFDSLAHWNGAALGQIAPSAFVPVAGQIGAGGRRPGADDGPCPARFHSSNGAAV
jgi:predicted signal transduction protein with EAL and GGDEF domain